MFYRSQLQTITLVETKKLYQNNTSTNTPNSFFLFLFFSYFLFFSLHACRHQIPSHFFFFFVFFFLLFLFSPRHLLLPSLIFFFFLFSSSCNRMTLRWSHFFFSFLLLPSPVSHLLRRFSRVEPFFSAFRVIKSLKD